MEWETIALFAAEPTPTTFPWVAVFTFLGVAIPSVIAAVAGTVATISTLRSNRLQKQIEAQTTEKAEQLKATTERGKQSVDLQKQADAHGESLLDKVLTRLVSVEKSLNDERAKCEEDKEELRDKLTVCWEARAKDREEMATMRAELRKEIKGVETRARDDSVNLHERVREAETKIKAAVPAPAAVAQPINMTLNVMPEPPAAPEEPKIIIPEDIRKNQ